MKTLVVVMMVFGFSAHAKNASCKAMDYKPIFEDTNPPAKSPQKKAVVRSQTVKTGSVR